MQKQTFPTRLRRQISTTSTLRLLNLAEIVERWPEVCEALFPLQERVLPQTPMAYDDDDDAYYRLSNRIPVLTSPQSAPVKGGGCLYSKKATAISKHGLLSLSHIRRPTIYGFKVHITHHPGPFAAVLLYLPPAAISFPAASKCSTA
jgi:hypothetical protein